VTVDFKSTNGGQTRPVVAEGTRRQIQP